MLLSDFAVGEILEGLFHIRKDGLMAHLLDGQKTAQLIKDELINDIACLKNRGITPGLAVILVGENPASKVYVGHKEKACQALGIYSEVIRMPETATTAEVLAVIGELNQRDAIHGILVQLPLPQAVDEQQVIEAIVPEKDVDGFHPINTGCLWQGKDAFIPCTPQGVMELLDRYDIAVAGKHAVIIGRSNIVGKPMAALLLAKSATVTICHSKTENLAGLTKQADIVIAAVGKPQFVTSSMVKAGAVVIDVGINRLDKKLVGDVDFASVQEIASAITPVPGGVGPLTIAMLLKNTVKAAKLISE